MKKIAILLLVFCFAMPVTAVQWLKQSTDATVKLGPFLDDTDGKTAETGLTITQADIRLSKNGGNIAQVTDSNAASHDELGIYDKALDETDTGTLGRLLIAVHESGALPVWKEFMVVPANVWDSMFGSDKLQVDSTQLLGTAYATPTTAGVPEVDVTYMNGNAMPCTTAQLISDGMGTTDVQKAVRLILEQAIDGDPNTGSISERIKTLDDAYTAARAALIDDIVADTAAWDTAAEAKQLLFGEDANGLTEDDTVTTTPTYALSTTMTGASTKTAITLAAGSTLSQAYQYAIITVKDDTDSHYEQRVCTNYTTGRVATLNLPLSFTPANGDDVYISFGSYFKPEKGVR